MTAVGGDGSKSCRCVSPRFLRRGCLEASRSEMSRQPTAVSIQQSTGCFGDDDEGSSMTEKQVPKSGGVRIAEVE